MQKKGQSEVLTTTLLFEVLAGFLLAGMLIYATMTTGNVQGFSKSYLKADHEILINMIKNTPGDVELEYDTGGYKYEEGEFYKGAFGASYSVKITKENGEITERSERIK